VANLFIGNDFIYMAMALRTNLQGSAILFRQKIHSTIGPVQMLSLQPSGLKSVVEVMN